MYKKPSATIDFIGIGTGRAASTWIYECLKEHPEICMAEPKETKFLFHSSDWNEYKKYFTECNNNNSTIRGEYSPGYMYSKTAAQHIKSLNPQVKLIVCLRNPIDRAISSYYFSKARGEITFGDLEHKVLDDLSKFPNEKVAYLERSFYYKYLTYYLDLFSRNQIHIIIYNDIKTNPKTVLTDLYAFLGVSTDFVPQILEQKINFVAMNRRHFPILSKLFFQSRDLLHQHAIGRACINLAKIIKIKTLIIKILQYNLRDVKSSKLKEIQKQTLSLNTEQKLYYLYKKDIEKIRELTGRKLPHWRV